jgi:hypothetical protein
MEVQCVNTIEVNTVVKSAGMNLLTVSMTV